MLKRQSEKGQTSYLLKKIKGEDPRQWWVQKLICDGINVNDYVILLIIFKNTQMAQPEETAEFIEKLVNMMDENKNIICWNQTETQIVIKDVRKMAELVIPAFFRHTKYESFVRQLNMYNFHKVCRQKNNTINFKNDLFFKGNEKNFFKIKRKKKVQGKIDGNASVEQCKYIKSHPSIPSHFKQLIIKLISYKEQLLSQSSKIKLFLADVNNDLKTPKFKRYDKDVQEMKSILQSINERSQNIDDLFSSSSKKLKPESQLTSYQERLDEVIDNPMIRARLLGVHSHESQLSLERVPDPNTFPRFTTKVSFINIIDVPHRDNWREEEDRMSVCSIENELSEEK